jgi:hypothetical protein
MSSTFSNGLKLGADLIASQFQNNISHLTAAESQIPSSDHAHVGDNNVYLLSRENMNFQMANSSNNITFITGHDDYATYYQSSSQKVYDFGSGSTLSFFNIAPGSVMQVFNSDHDSRFQLYLHDWPNQTITSDGHGGTLVGGTVDIVQGSIKPDHVHFVNSDPAFVRNSITGQYPLPPHADY